MKSPAFQFYAKDWLSSAKITIMTLAQEGAYIHLIAHCWDDEDCSLPDDDAVLSRLSRAGEDWYKGGYNLVKECFQPFGNSAVCSLQSANNKQKKNITNVILKENRKTRLPDSFIVTDQHRELATTNGWPSPDAELDAFRDYHLGNGTLMLNWDRAFHTWLRNAKRFQSKSLTNGTTHAKQLTHSQQRRKESWDRCNAAIADADYREMRDVTPSSTEIT